MNSKAKITVYTPTYNRAYCLSRLYNSLLRQTCRDFIWWIIDDGSTDNTKALVHSWIKDGDLDIKYHFQENAGKQEAVNFIHTKLKTELNVCMDSDDYMVDDAIESILDSWAKHGSEEFAGLVGLARFEDGLLVGTDFPKNLKAARFCDFTPKHNIKGDKKYVYRTEIVKAYPPYPKFENEKFPAPGYLYRLIDQDYKLLLFNKTWSIVEYLPDGISSNKITAMKKNPNSFMYYRKERMRLAISIKDKTKNAIHYGSVCLFAGKLNKIITREHLLINIGAFPFSVLLYFYLRFTKRKGVV